jgi:hypothetical protein
MPSNRRRQRSVRITVAVLLLVVAGLVVLAALLLAELVVVALAAVVAFLAGVCAVRLVLDELVRSRRDAAEDRVSQARAYQTMDARRADEHATFATMMKSSLDEANDTVGELNGTLRLAERRVELAEQRARHESRRRGELQHRVDELTSRLESSAGDDAVEGDGLGAAPAEESGAAVPYWDPDVPTVVDLLAWEDRDVDAPDADKAEADADTDSGKAEAGSA